jgi:DeoR/GlpR family transcriptional regulator of sugar metabolism
MHGMRPDLLPDEARITRHPSKLLSHVFLLLHVFFRMVYIDLLVVARYTLVMHDYLPLSRRDTIAGRLAQGQTVVAAMLAAEFEVSEDAIRRDLRTLAAEGKCRRVYGGALPLSPGLLPMAARIEAAADRKLALARAAVSPIERGEFLFLDSGSTNLALVSLLPEDHGLTVATNSIDIAAALLRRGDISLIVVGGSVDTTVGGSVDASAVASVRQMNIDRCFIGACSISPAIGIGSFVHPDALFKRSLLKHSRVRVAMVTADKFNERAPHRVGGPADFETVVVEKDMPNKDWEALAAAGFHVIHAS